MDKESQRIAFRAAFFFVVVILLAALLGCQDRPEVIKVKKGDILNRVLPEQWGVKKIHLAVYVEDFLTFHRIPKAEALQPGDYKVPPNWLPRPHWYHYVLIFLVCYFLWWAFATRDKPPIKQKDILHKYKRPSFVEKFILQRKQDFKAVPRKSRRNQKQLKLKLA